MSESRAAAEERDRLCRANAQLEEAVRFLETELEDSEAQAQQVLEALARELDRERR